MRYFERFKTTQFTSTTRKTLNNSSLKELRMVFAALCPPRQFTCFSAATGFLSGIPLVFTGCRNISHAIWEYRSYHRIYFGGGGGSRTRVLDKIHVSRYVCVPYRFSTLMKNGRNFRCQHLSDPGNPPQSYRSGPRICYAVLTRTDAAAKQAARDALWDMPREIKEALSSFFDRLLAWPTGQPRHAFNTSLTNRGRDAPKNRQYWLCQRSK